MDENTPATNEALLQELALRLSTSPGDPRISDPQLLVGQLPGNLLVEIPLPEGSRVLGSLIRSQEHIDIVFDSDLSPEDVLSFYEERMSAAGWNDQEMMRPAHGGFVHTGFAVSENRRVFCSDPQGAALTVSAYPGKHTGSDVRLDLNASSEHSPCAQRTRMPSQVVHRGLGELIPALVPPKGARQQNGGGGGGRDRWHSFAMLETDRDLVTLATHYPMQLEKGGWVRSGIGQDGPVAWSTWTFQDKEKEPWRGLFFIFKVPEREREYILEVMIFWEGKDNGGSGPRLMGDGWSSSYGVTRFGH